MAAPVPQAVGALASGAGAISVAWPTHQADDVGVLVIETMGQAVPAVSGWTQFSSSPQRTGAGGTTDTELTVYWKRATGSTEANASVGDSGNHQIGVIGTIRGCITTGDPFDVTTGDILAAANTAVSVPGHTTTVVDCLIVALCSAGTDTDTPQFSSWANADLTSVAEWFDLFSVQANGGGFGVATGIKAAVGAFGATTATLATSSKQGRIVIAFKPPASGPTEVPVSDTAALAVSEAQDSLLTSSPVDTAALSVAEAQDSLLLSDRPDTAALAVGEAVAVTVTIEVPDTAALALTETSASFLQSERVDVAALAVAETTASLLSSDRVDNLALVASEAAINLLLSEVADALGLAAVDAAVVDILGVSGEPVDGPTRVTILLRSNKAAILSRSNEVASTGRNHTVVEKSASEAET